MSKKLMILAAALTLSSVNALASSVSVYLCSGDYRGNGQWAGSTLLVDGAEGQNFTSNNAWTHFQVLVNRDGSVLIPAANFTLSLGKMANMPDPQQDTCSTFTVNPTPGLQFQAQISRDLEHMTIDPHVGRVPRHDTITISGAAEPITVERYTDEFVHD